MSDDTPPPPPSQPRWPTWIEVWVLPYMENRSLWPVWIALVGHVVVGVAGLGLLGWRTGLPEAWIALGLVAAGSGWLVQLEWRATSGLRGVSLTVVLMWASSFALAALADVTGMF